ERRARAFSQVVKFLEQRLSSDLEVKACLALHVGSQFFAHTFKRLRITVDTHQMKTHVGFAGLNPGHRNRWPLHLAAQDLSVAGPTRPPRQYRIDESSATDR